MLIAYIDTPVPADRMAVLEISELPGKASIIDWAFFLGSSAGTLEAFRAEMICVVRAGRFRIGNVGRRRAVPAINQYGLTTVRRDWEFDLPIAVLASLEAMFVVLLPIEKLKLDVGNEEFELPLAKAGSSL